MKINNRTFSIIYIIFIMFLPTSFFIIDKPGIPLISVQRFFVISWIILNLTLLINNRFILKPSIKIPYKQGVVYCAVLLGLASIATFESNQSALLYYISILTESFFPAFMVWTAFNSKKQMVTVIKLMVYIYTLIALYGVVAYVVNNNPLLEFLTQAGSSRELTFSYGDELRGGIIGRAQSFFTHPLQFGYISTAILIFIIGVNSSLLFTRIQIFAICAIMIAALLSSASRSPIFMLAVSASVYAVHINVKKFFVLFAKILFISFFLLWTGLLETLIGDHFLLIKSIYLDIFFGDSGLGGSTLNMRDMQLTAAMTYFSDSPIYGHGFTYIRSLIENNNAGALLGAESFAFKLIIEIGILGIAGYSILYSNIYYNFIKNINSKVERVFFIAITGASLMFGHLAFIFSTGEMGMTNIYLILTTLLFRLIILTLNENNISKNNSFDVTR